MTDQTIESGTTDQTIKAGTTVYIVDPFDLKAGVQPCLVRERFKDRFVFVDNFAGAFALGHDCALTVEDAKQLLQRHKSRRISYLEDRIAELHKELEEARSI